MAVAITGINGRSIAYTYEWVADEAADITSFDSGNLGYQQHWTGLTGRLNGRPQEVR